MINHYIIKGEGPREWVHTGPVKSKEKDKTDLEKAVQDVLVYTKGTVPPGVQFYVLSTERELKAGTELD